MRKTYQVTHSTDDGTVEVTITGRPRAEQLQEAIRHLQNEVQAALPAAKPDLQALVKPRAGQPTTREAEEMSKKEMERLYKQR